jgi:exodeoxyribonuclease VII large subunit
VLIWPVLVQGPEAAEQVAAAIAGFNRLTPDAPVPRPDVLIVARGGGSIEDLWAFNEETVARAAAASAIPVITAVGHETDTTLIDFAADLRAPTPSAAAEMAVPVRIDLAARLLTLNTRLLGGMNRMLEEKRSRLLAARRGLPNPQTLLAVARQRLDDWGDRLRQGLAIGLDRRRRRLAHAAARLPSPARWIAHECSRLAGESRALDSALRAYLLERGNRLRHTAALLSSFSYERILERGFALVQDRLGHVVTSVKALRPGTSISVRLADGKTDATVDGGRTASRSTRRSEADQGTLL